eukprot:maker-scaffold42_size484952-snap-gene-2.11 protein:Tk06363 transcript:maker-scaffold42_size484952-snap-gene-2.11-mRNA-1 annotation:"spt transcription factor family member"
MSAPESLPAWLNQIRMNLPNREELSFLTVLALPQASSTGLVWTILSSREASPSFLLPEAPTEANAGLTSDENGLIFARNHHALNIRQGPSQIRRSLQLLQGRRCPNPIEVDYVRLDKFLRVSAKIRPRTSEACQGRFCHLYIREMSDILGISDLEVTSKRGHHLPLLVWFSETRSLKAIDPLIMRFLGVFLVSCLLAVCSADDHYGHHKKCHYKYKTVYETIYETIYKEKCEHDYKEKCETYYETKYKTEYKKECQTVYDEKCLTDYKTDYKEECHTDYEEKCHTYYETKYETEYKDECHTIYKEVCHDVGYGYHKEKKCDHVPDKKCKQVPFQVPKQIPKQSCKSIPKKSCKKVPFQVPFQQCHPVPKKDCKDIPVEVPFQVPKQKCEKVPVKHCHKVPEKVPKKEEFGFGRENPTEKRGVDPAAGTAPAPAPKKEPETTQQPKQPTPAAKAKAPTPPKGAKDGDADFPTFAEFGGFGAGFKRRSGQGKE